MKPRLNRALARGVKVGALVQLPGDYFKLPDGGARPAADKEWGKWSTPLHLDETDGRGKPRIKGIRVDIGQTLSNVMEHIGRPCTLDEIVAAWGKLRAKRTNPLVGDLSRLIAADEKRARKLAKRAGSTNGRGSMTAGGK